MIKVLTAIVVPPHMAASGGAHAAERLSAALATHCEVSVASMMARGGDSGLWTARLPVVSRLPRLVPWSWLPQGVRTLFYRSDIGELVRRGGVDLVHIHNPMPALEMRRVARACRDNGIPYVVTTHGFNEVATGHRIYGFGWLKRAVWHALVYRPVSQVVRGAAAVVGLSPADTPIVRAMGFEGPDLSVVPNGIDRPKPRDASGDVAILAKYDIPPVREPGRITCMFLANHTPNKGLPVLLRAFKSLDRPYLLIVGGECRPDIDYDEFVGSTGKDQRIIVTGRLDDGEVAVLMQRADLFVFPSLADTLPLVVFEAMSQGLAILASDVGGIRYQIDESCGALVPPGDPAAIAAQVEHLAADPERLASMRANATARAATLGTWEDAAVSTVCVYEKVLRRHCGTRRRNRLEGGTAPDRAADAHRATV